MQLSKQKMLARLSLILMLMSGVIGCAKSVSDYCLIAKPITPTKADTEVISDELVMQILEHDETYFSLCNKKAID